jgi:methylated-DNA-[protein]-cysteine S-methyltransferase
MPTLSHAGTVQRRLYGTPFGTLFITATAEGVCSVDWREEGLEQHPLHEEAGGPIAADADKSDAAAAARWAEEAARQLEEYFAGRRKKFDVPLVLRGTPFQMAVWKALQEIPYGETRSYKEVAAAIGRASAVRAVGQANRANPVAIIVPCHRVVGSNGSLTGYAGAQIHLKEKLLNLEQAHS